MLKRNLIEEKKEGLNMLSNRHTWETIKRNMLLDSEEFSLHQRLVEEGLKHLHGAGNREIEAVRLVASVKDSVGRGVDIVEWSPGNGHRMRQTRRVTRDSEIQGYTVWKGTSRII